MKVYILIEQVFSVCEDSYFEVLGVYKNIKDAKEEKEKAMQENLQYYEFVKDEERPEKRIFQGFQENWDNYIEYSIIEKEVL